VLERRKDVMFKVNTKERGDVFGEISLMYDCPRSATVAAPIRAASAAHVSCPPSSDERLYCGRSSLPWPIAGAACGQSPC
jgi:hypothetical protein